MHSRDDEGVPESVLRDLYPERFTGPEAEARAEIGRMQDALAAARTCSLGEDVVERVARAICKAAGDHWFASEDFAYSNEQYRKYARAALSALRPVQEEGGEPKCAQCGGMRDDLAPGREPEELCDPCHDDAVAALKRVQEEGK